MLKLKTPLFAWPITSIEKLVQLRPSALLLTLIACFGSCQFTAFATAQLAIDGNEGTFTSVLGTESDVIWDAYPTESHGFAGEFASPDCCPETLEPAYAKEDRSLCTIKSILGCTETIEIRPEDEIWIVSARNYDGCLDNREAIEVERLANNSWQPSSLDELAHCHQTNTSLTTLLYAHGNATDYDFGISRGVQFYRNLASCPEVEGPIRMVLWLWKSEKEAPRLYRDFRIKAERAIQMGPAFQTTLERLGDSRVALVGFSLGAQVILSALDSMEEQQSSAYCGLGCSSFQNGGMAGKYRVALIAPALDPAYACAAADRTVSSSITAETRVFCNRSDRVIKALRIVLRRECPKKSVSFNKLACQQRLNVGQVKHVDLTGEAGAWHSIVRYSRAQSLCCKLGNLLSEVAADRILADQPVPNNQFAVE